MEIENKIKHIKFADMNIQEFAKIYELSLSEHSSKEYPYNTISNLFYRLKYLEKFIRIQEKCTDFKKLKKILLENGYEIYLIYEFEKVILFRRIGM